MQNPQRAPQPATSSSQHDLGLWRLLWFLAGAVAPVMGGTIGYYLFDDTISMGDGMEGSASHGLMPMLGILGGIGVATVALIVVAAVVSSVRPAAKTPGRVLCAFLGLFVPVVLFIPMVIGVGALVG